MFEASVRVALLTKPLFGMILIVYILLHGCHILCTYFERIHIKKLRKNVSQLCKQM